MREVDGGADLLHVEGGGREVDFDGDAGGPQVAGAVDGRVELAAHAHPVEGRARSAVEAHLDSLDAERCEALAVRRRQVVAVRLDLELPAAAAKALHHREKVRMHHRLAAREGHVRDLQRDHLVDDGEGVALRELVGKSLARTALLDAVQTGKVALVGDLPRDVERRAEILERGAAYARGDRRVSRVVAAASVTPNPPPGPSTAGRR
jgi:hypothetical protein